MIEHYVQVLYPGIIVSDSSEYVVGHRDPKRFELSKHAFGFRFFDKEVLDGETGKTYGKGFNHSPWYYEGRECTIEDIEQEEPDSILHRNMKTNSFKRVVKTKFGQAIPLDEKDVVLYPHTSLGKVSNKC